MLLSIQGTPGREETFAKRVSAFNAHANQMATTAADLARSGGVMDKQVADELISTSGKVSHLTVTWRSSRESFSSMTYFATRSCSMVPWTIYLRLHVIKVGIVGYLWSTATKTLQKIVHYTFLHLIGFSVLSKCVFPYRILVHSKNYCRFWEWVPT